MSADWKTSLLSVANASSARAHIAAVVEEAIDAGASLEDVQRFADSTPSLASVAALFRDGFFDHRTQKQAHTVVGGDVERRRSASGSAGRKAHAVRADPTSSLPWFRRASLPAAPPSTLVSAGAGGAVTVDGERFDASDIASLLRLVASGC
jgi:hypothetical protein